jgi:anti-sigma B factor antagonist
MTFKTEPLVEFTTVGRIVVGRVTRSRLLSALNVSEFAQTILDYLSENPKCHLLLDFSEVDYLSSAVLTELLRIKKVVEENGGTLRLCGVSKVVMEIFQITNLDRVFSIHEESAEVDVARYERALDLAAQEAAWQASDPSAQRGSV